MTRPRVALAAGRDFTELPFGEDALPAVLASLGIEAEVAVWDDPAVDWDAYDLVVVRTPWDYTTRREEFLAWAARVPRVRNSADVLTWNTDKRYLAELATAGVPVVPTSFVAPEDGGDAIDRTLPHGGTVVVKPTVSVGSHDSGSYDCGDAEQRDAAVALARDVLAGGRTVMVQPYVEGIDADGETSLLLFRGALSHAVRRDAMLDGPWDPARDPRERLRWAPVHPTAEQRAVADDVLAALRWPAEEMLYARVDLVPGPDGPLLMELEVTEPALFLAADEAAPGRFAAAVAAALG